MSVTRFEFTEPLTVDHMPLIEGFRIPDGGIGGGAGIGLKKRDLTIIGQIGWFIRGESGEVIDMKAADSFQVTLAGGELRAFLTGKSAPNQGRYQDLITKAYEAVARSKGWQGQVLGLDEEIADLMAEEE